MPNDTQRPHIFIKNEPDPAVTREYEGWKGEAKEDIIAEWSEPRKGVAWLYVYEDGEMIAIADNQECAIRDVCISKTRVEWEENQ